VSALVFLESVECGVLEQNASGNLSFEYHQDYQPGQTPLSLSMPVSEKRFAKRTVLPFIEGLLPENDNALTAIARRYGVSPRNAFAMLKHLGLDLAGAVQIVSDRDELVAEKQSTRALSAEEVEALLIGKVSEFETGTGGSSNERMSLAGAQPKVALRLNTKGQWFSGSSQLATTHILKPATARLSQIDIIEHLTMRAASKLGLTVANSELAIFGETPTFIVERFDRMIDPLTGKVSRLHQEDLCQALAVSPSKKHQELDGGPGLASARILFQNLPVLQDRERVTKDFFRAVAFNVLAKCPDAHAKNYSLMLDKDSVSLAPLYDLNTGVTLKVRQSSAMSINSKYSFSQITLDDLQQEGERLKLQPDWVADALNHLSQNLLGAFESARDETASKNNLDGRVATVGSAILQGLA
jgi:serine/threonine-protein kinase HipA